MVLLTALLFLLAGLAVQIWRLASFSASFDQALFLQELWSTLQGRPFESTLSSELSAAVKVHDALPQLGYRHLSQHVNVVTLLATPLLPLLGLWTLPVVQVGLLTLAALALHALAASLLPAPLALRLMVAFCLSGTVIGPMVENYHDLCAIPLLGFLLITALVQRRPVLIAVAAILLLLVRQDVGLVVFSIGLWAVARRPDARRAGWLLMGGSVAYVLVVTTLVQPQFGSDVTDRFMQEKFAPFLADGEGGPLQLLLAMAGRPGLLLRELVTPPAATLAFLLAPALPLALVPLRSVDVGWLVSVPLAVALLSSGRSALSVTLRYVMALVPGLFAGTVFWWQARPQLFRRAAMRRFWTACLAVSLLLTLLSNPYRSFSALIPDSIRPWVHVGPAAMLRRAEAARQALAVIPAQASVAADTPLLPRLARREVALRFPQHHAYRDRSRRVREVDWIAALPGYYRPFMPLFKEESEDFAKIAAGIRDLVADGRYGVAHCSAMAVVLRRGQHTDSASAACLERLLEPPAGATS